MYYHRLGDAQDALIYRDSDEDTRIALLHSYKYAAVLQDAQAGDAEILLRIKHKAGYFAEGIDDTADALAFITEQLGKF